MSAFQRMIDTVWDKLSNEETWLALGEGTLKIILTMIVAALVVKVGKAAIRNFFHLRSKAPLKYSERRENTLLKLMENIVAYVVYFIALLNVLAILSFDIKGLIAGAGVVGLAVGFGAQNLVRDVISGFFIIFEDQFSVGDFVRISTFEGTVEEIGLRTTKIKNWTGELHILPNGSISQVTNFSLHNSVAVVDISIAYEENIQVAEETLEVLLETLPGKYEEIVAPPQLLGVQNLSSSDVILRVIAETTPMNHWFIARMIRKEVKVCLDEHGIDAPFPRLVMYSREDQKEHVDLKKNGERVSGG